MNQDQDKPENEKQEHEVSPPKSPEKTTEETKEIESPARVPVQEISETNDPNKNVFNFDINKTMDAAKDLAGKVAEKVKNVQITENIDKIMDAMPFGKRDKPSDGIDAGYSNVNMAEDPNGNLNAYFALYGEITMKRDTIKNLKKEADPALFDIEMEEDEFEEQAGLSNIYYIHRKLKTE